MVARRRLWPYCKEHGRERQMPAWGQDAARMHETRTAAAKCASKSTGWMTHLVTRGGAEASRRATPPVTLTYGTPFSGIGGIDLGLDLAGFRPMWQVEKNDFCLRVLKRHWPEVPKFSDVRECGHTRRNQLERVDLVAGGFPCQDHSGAGKRRGLGTPDNPTKRGGLWFEQLRIIRELRPRWAVVENVSRLLHTKDSAGIPAGVDADTAGPEPCRDGQSGSQVIHHRTLALPCAPIYSGMKVTGTTSTYSQDEVMKCP